MTEKNILLIGDSLESGGAAQLLNRTGQILKFNGHNVVYFTGDGLVDFSKVVEPKYSNVLKNSNLAKIFKVTVIKLLKHIFKCSYQDVLLNVRHLYFPEMENKLINLIRENDFDFAHVNNIHGRLSTRVYKILHKNKIPIITQINDYYFFCNSYYAYNKQTDSPCDKCIHGNVCSSLKYGCSQYFNAGSPRIEAARRFLLNIFNPWGLTSVYFATSNTTAGILRKWGVDEGKIHLIKNPFLDSEFNVDISLGNKVIFYGSNLKLKGVDVFLESLRYIKSNTKLGVYLMGMTDDFENSLKRIAKDNKIEIEIINNISWDSGLKEKIAKEASCVVIPSQWWVTSENVVYESMLLGKPVVVSDFGGNKELVDDKINGLYFKVRDSEDLAQKINLITEDKELNRSLAKSALSKAQSYFSQKTFYQSYINGAMKII